MVSESSHRLYVRILEVGQLLDLTRFYWNEKTCRLVYRPKGFHVWRETIHLWVLILYNMFIVVRDWQVTTSDKFSIKQKVSISYFVVLFVLLSSHQVLCIVIGRELCAYVNGLMIYTKRTPGKKKLCSVAVKKERVYARLRWFVRTRIAMSLFAGGTNCITAALKPKSPIFLTSLVDGPLPKWMRIAGATFHIYIYVAQYYYLLLVIATTMYSCYCVVPVMKSLDENGTKWLEYRVLYVLQIYYNKIFQHWMSCQIFLDTFGIIVNVYLAVILKSLRGVVVTCLAYQR